MKESMYDPDIMTLAQRRYPDDRPHDAYAFFLSDRQTAGLGALAKRNMRKARLLKDVRNCKMFGFGQIGFEAREIEYRCHILINKYVRVREPHQFDFRDVKIDFRDVKIDINLAIDTRVSIDLFSSQTGRNQVAYVLRANRRDLREAVKAELKKQGAIE